ncbi:MAG: chemotaxis protein CheW, partial [Lacrimispora sp.]
YFKGVMNLRSSIVPVIDIRLRMGNSETSYTQRSCTIIANIQGALFGFIVDEVEEVLDISPEQISFAPRLSGGGTSDYLTGIGRLQAGENTGEKIVLLLNLSAIFSDDEFLALSQAVQG